MAHTVHISVQTPVFIPTLVLQCSMHALKTQQVCGAAWRCCKTNCLACFSLALIQEF